MRTIVALVLLAAAWCCCAQRDMSLREMLAAFDAVRAAVEEEVAVAERAMASEDESTRTERTVLLTRSALVRTTLVRRHTGAAVYRVDVPLRLVPSTPVFDLSVALLSPGPAFYRVFPGAADWRAVPSTGAIILRKAEGENNEDLLYASRVIEPASAGFSVLLALPESAPALSVVRVDMGASAWRSATAFVPAAVADTITPLDRSNAPSAPGPSSNPSSSSTTTTYDVRMMYRSALVSILGWTLLTMIIVASVQLLVRRCGGAQRAHVDRVEHVEHHHHHELAAATGDVHHSPFTKPPPPPPPHATVMVYPGYK